MITIIKIILLHTIILASQALYMYLSNKEQLKKTRYLYFIALPIVMAVPVIFNHHSEYAYSMYEYAIVMCIFTAATADVSCAAFNREYMNDEKIRSLHYAYFLICALSAFIGGAGYLITIISVSVLIALLIYQIFIRRHSAAEFVKSFPIVIFSLACSWMLLRFML